MIIIHSMASKAKSKSRLNVSSKKRDNNKSDTKIQSLRKKCAKCTVTLNRLSGKSALKCAKQQFHASSVPQTLPCRDEQFKDIYHFVHSKLIENNGGCMYISGVPGTGKTATVYKVISKLRCDSEVPNFKFIEINGLGLSEPYHCYVQFLLELTGEKLSSYNAADELNDYFNDPMPKKEFVVLLVDELDLLKTRKQNILYHIFDWPLRPNSKLIVLAIANAMDLPERVMINRVISRLGLTRLAFQPYSYKELQEIVNSRIQNFHVFDNDALQLVCRKVAALSGDARRALDICRRSIEMAQLEDSDFVDMSHVEKALNEMFNSPKIIAIRNASVQEQIFLKSIVAEFRISGLEEAVLINVYKHHIESCRFEGQYTPTTAEIAKIAHYLSALRLIILENNRCDLQRRIRLNVAIDDVNFALNM